MSNQRPPGGVDGPTEDPDRERNKPSGGTPPERHYAPAEFQPPPQPPPAPQPWVDPERTQPYVPGRRSIAERLRQQSREPETLPPPDPPPRPQPQAAPRPQPQAAPQPAQPPQPPQPPQPARPAQNPKTTAKAAAKPVWQERARQRAKAKARSGSGARRLFAILAGVVVLGLAAGAGAAWFSGWRPGFLANTTDEAKTSDPANTTNPGDTPPDKPGDKPPETKPADPTPPATELARSCFTARTEVKAGPGACGFTIEAGALSFRGQRIADRLAVGNAAAQRLLLYPFSPSGRFVFLRACETAGGGRCAVQSLVDTKERKLFGIKGDAEELRLVAFSPKEEVGLLFYRDGTADSVAAVSTGDGKVLLSAAIKSARNEYAMVRERTLRWPDENSFSIEVKLCPFDRDGRNTKCEQDEKVRFRRRLVKLAR